MWLHVIRLIGLQSLVVFLLLSCVSPQTKRDSGKNPLKIVTDVPMPGPAVRFDYQSLDTTTGQLYIAHMNADQLVVFDTASRKVLANLDGFARVHAVWAVPEINRVFASATGEHKLAVVDSKSLQTIAKVGPIKYPDGIAYAPGPKRVFVSDEHADVDAVIDAGTNRLIKNVELGGGAGNTVYDPTAKRILVAVHEKNELVAIDPDKLEIIGRFPLPGIKEPHGIALDTANGLAFVAGAGNKVLAVVDLSRMQVLGTYPVGKDPDVLAFDPGLRQLYVSAESGDVWVYRENGKGLVAMGNFFMPHAHTVSVDPKTNLVYFPLENIDGHPLLRIMEPALGASPPTTQRSRPDPPDGYDREKGEESAATLGAVVLEQPAPLQGASTQFIYNFDSDAPGQTPTKFHSAKTGGGTQGKWVVMADATAPSKPNVVAQTSTDTTDYRFPLLIADEGSFKDLDISVRFKAVSGKVDRAGGLVFRLRDPNNYYIVRANALEDNYRLYHVVDGKRRQFAGANFKVTSGEWHELRVEVAGNKFTCYYDGNKKIEATDDTFRVGGRVGLWTKADSVTYFDDLKVTAK